MTVRDDSGVSAFEVVLASGLGNLTQQHLLERVKAGCSQVTVLCEAATLEKVVKRVEGLERVRVVPLKDFLIL